MSIPLIVCGDFNGGAECGAVRYLEDGKVDETFIEDGEPVTSSLKSIPLSKPMKDATIQIPGRTAPPTLVVSELIPLLVADGAGSAYENPRLSDDAVQRLTRIHSKLSSTCSPTGEAAMTVEDVTKWLVKINGQLGRGSEFREAVRQMRKSSGNALSQVPEGDVSNKEDEDTKKYELPEGSLLYLEGFLRVYEEELRGGKFWGIAHDLAVLGEPLPDRGVYESRYDRMYCSSPVQTVAVMDFLCSRPCPNDQEPSDHLPVGAAFRYRES